MNGKQLVLCVAMLSCILDLWNVSAAELFVDQKHPEAKDDNPGTEAMPFRTIQPAVDAARPDDIVYVKAGVYSDQVKLRTFGHPRFPPTLTAWKEDRVIIGSELRELPPADQWTPIEGHKSFQVQLPEGTPDDLIVILDGKPMATQYVAENVPDNAVGVKCKDAPPDDNKLNWAVYRNRDRTLMVNTGDGNPATMHKVQYARRVELFQVTETGAYWKIKNLEFAWCNSGICLPTAPASWWKTVSSTTSTGRQSSEPAAWARSGDATFSAAVSESAGSMNWAASSRTTSSSSAARTSWGT